MGDFKIYLTIVMTGFPRRGYQSQVKESGHMGGSRFGSSMRAPHSRPINAGDVKDTFLAGAGVLSRGVGLRGFESHPPHQESKGVKRSSTFALGASTHAVKG